MKKLVALLAAVLTLSVVSVVAYAQDAAPDTLERQQAKQRIQEKMAQQGYTQVPAESIPQMLSDAEIDPETFELAYSDIETASPEQREEILAARRQVAYSVKEWYVDNGDTYLVAVNDGRKEWHEMPTFAELFPGWDPIQDPADAPVEVTQVVESIIAPCSVNTSYPPVVYTV